MIGNKPLTDAELDRLADLSKINAACWDDLEPVFAQARHANELLAQADLCYAELDKLGIGSAIGELCDDPACNSKLLHRVKHMLPRHIAASEAEVKKLQAFKTYVHARLDAAGVPADPESPHKAQGCRIGGRLDWVLKMLEDAKRFHTDEYQNQVNLTEEVKRLREAANRAFFNHWLGKVWHKDFCLVRNVEENGCECGYSKISAALAPSAPATADTERTKSMSDTKPIDDGPLWSDPDGVFVEDVERGFGVVLALATLVTDTPSAPPCPNCGGVMGEWEGHNTTEGRELRCISCGEKRPLWWRYCKAAAAPAPQALPDDDGETADEVHKLWSNAVASLCSKIGVDPKSFDWSPAETTEETIGGIVGNIIERLPKEPT